MDTVDLIKIYLLVLTKTRIHTHFQAGFQRID